MLFHLKRSFQISKYKVYGFGVILLILLYPQISSGHDKERPAFNQSRYKEDFQFLKNSEKRTDFFDSLKYIRAPSILSLFPIKFLLVALSHTEKLNSNLSSEKVGT